MTTDIPEAGDTSSSDYSSYDMTTGAWESTPEDITTASKMTAASTTGSPEAAEDDDFIYLAMAAIGGTVVLIIVLVIIAFIVKSRRTRRHNLRVYTERRERPLTVSLDLIDREEHVPEAVNGVQNAIYSQDTILPIAVFESQVQDQTSGQHPRPVQLVGTNGAKKGELCDVQGVNSSAQQNETVALASTQNETIASTAVVYENTKFSKQGLLTASDKPKQLSMPNLNDETKFSLQRRHNSQKHAKTVSINSDYETAFPVFPVLNNKGKAEIENVDKCDGNVGTDRTELPNDSNKCSTNEEHKDVVEIYSVKEDTNISKTRHEKIKPKVKPKPNVKRLGNISSNVLSAEVQTKDEPHDYENSLAKIKRTKFKEAKLLKTVPPPCNTNTYVNVPESKSNVSTSKNSSRRQSSEYVNVPEKRSTNSALEHSVQRQSSGYENVPDKLSINLIPEEPLKRQSSSEYEDAGCVSRLQKLDKCITSLAEINFKEENEKHKKQEDSKHSEPKLKELGTRPKYSVLKSQLPVPKAKQYGSEYKPVKLKMRFSESKAKLGVPKPDYANSAERGRSLSENPDRKAVDYENEDMFNALKSSLKKQGKRGFSTSSLETCRQDKMRRTGQMNTPEATAPNACKITDDDPYLMMDAGNNGEDLYLRMDSQNDDIYMPMVTPKDDDEYMSMENNYSYPRPARGKKLLSDSSNKDEDVRFARCYQTCPKPCGGVRSAAYDNFSEQPTRYANFFRSRSTDNVYSYVGSKPFIRYS
ncbi:uncharacterized protein LOC123528475 [Mercenaria mercenaria]|uniref:uncharacterized protein LOC123528475 n=1 Tax=Mercenaria mercenaria TaxID=6596 RepID=UPI00234E8267|nr:uncharacterized protein LOC123528475 [Mercenaria mercenaria]